MSRALLTLLAGIVLAVLLAAVIAGDGDLLSVLGPVLVTTTAGAAVFAVVAWRARIRERARRLEDHQEHEVREVREVGEVHDRPHRTTDVHDAHDAPDTNDDRPLRPTTAPVTPEEETDRG